MRALLTFVLVAGLVFVASPANAAAPSNDNFANATVIGSLPFTDAVFAGDATIEPGEPQSSSTCAVGDHTIWYRFTPTNSLRVVGDTSQSDHNVTYGVYTGSAVSALTTVACDENQSGDPHPTFAFSAVAGTTYYIQLGIFQNDGTIRFTFEAAASIAGTVRGGGHRPLAGICVEAYDAAHPFEVGSSNFVAVTTSDRRGHYTIGDLVAGAFRLRFSDCRNAVYAPQWYNNKLDFASADPVTAPAGGTAQADVSLAKGGSITGTITDSVTRAPLANVCADAYDGSDSLFASGFSNAKGAYTITPLPQSTFKVKFSTCASGPDYFSQWFNNKPDLASADGVSVTTGTATTGINAVLVPATGTGSISGRVTNTNNEPIPTVCVSVFEPGGTEVSGATTSSDGTYSVPGLGSGQFKVEFQACATFPYAATEWYDNQPNIDSANPVTVLDGSDTAGIDASLDIPWSGISHITGTIRDGSGNPVPGICVTAYVSADQSVGGDYSRSDGSYRIDGLGTGTFKLQFVDCSTGAYQSQWYDGKADFTTGDPVSVTDGTDTTGVDVTMSSA